MRNLLFFLVLFSSSFLFGQIGSCGNRITSVTFSPVTGNTDITVSINSDCCEIHNLETFGYSNNAPNHSITLCYRDSGLLMPSSITSQIVLPNANTNGSQNFTINSFYFFGIPGGNCSANTVFNAPITLSFDAPLLAPRIFTLAINAFETSKLKLYPNPNNGEFRIDLPEVIGEVQLRVFDISGKEVYTNFSYYSGNLIALKNLSTGLYFAKIVSKQSTEVLKFVID